MNKIRALLQSQNCLSGSNIKFPPSLPSELIEIIKESGVENKFFKVFQDRIKVLKDHGLESIILFKEFEKLKHYENMYSMRIKISRAINIRILYSYLDNGEILLHCFDKKSDSKVNDYVSHVPVALERLKEINEG